MSAITTHVLDTAHGAPATGLRVQLEVRDASGGWRGIAGGATDSDGRLRTLVASGESLAPGIYRLIFDVGRYFGDLGIATFYSQVTVEFVTIAGESHYHVPLLLSPFGYSTYRGT